ncbi:MAG: glycosyltransferase [Lachnospiraceae bacterium]|nr:glycosyltransferase [Lachnospiraceae bacterium]
MNTKKYKLTISLLASNRKDTLPKTLESLKPILDNVSSELIVVDTGCDEDLLEIVRQYTDKIEKFEWCKDFAKARNVGINKAQGDWFMFIDDDEWFEDVTEFIEFFNSDEMMKYNYGKYLVRNYDNMEGTSWSDSIAGRMFRLFEGTKFIDAVHERPVNIAGPTKEFVSYAHHYGYVYKTEEDKRAHVKRNTELLLEQIKNEPAQARHYCHLTQEYNNIKEYQKSLEYALEGINNADMSIRDNIKDVPGLYGNVIWVMINQFRFEEVIDKSQEYLTSPYINEMGKLALFGFCATASYKLERYRDSIEYAENFFEMVDYFDKNPKYVYEQDATLISICLLPENIERITGIAFAAGIMLEDINKVEKYARLMDNGPRALVDAEKCMKILARLVMNLLGYKKEFINILNKVALNRIYFSICISTIEEEKQKNMQGFLYAADILDEVDSDNSYILYMKIISNRDTDVKMLEELYDKAISSINDIINLDHIFWTIAIQRKIDIGKMIVKKPMNRWIETIDEWAVRAKLKEIVEKTQDLSVVVNADSMHMKYFNMMIAEAFFIRKKLEGISFEELRMDVIRYADAVKRFYAVIYRTEIFKECFTILPSRCQVAIILEQVINEGGDKLDGRLDYCVELLPNVARIVKKIKEFAAN